MTDFTTKDVEADCGPGSLNIEYNPNRNLKSTSNILEKILALIVLISFSLVFVILAFFIALGGQSPIFCQNRVGFKGRLFRIYKFRTIPDVGWDAAQRRASESFVAAIRLYIFKCVSKVLRSTGLDELPQFANIVIGNMQIIGPRPLVINDFIALPERRLERCAVPPGITGLAQINGGQNLDPTSKLALDLYLIDNLSFGIVIKIVMRTALRIVGGASATAQACAHDLKLAKYHMEFGRSIAVAATNSAPDRSGMQPQASTQNRPRRLVSLMSGPTLVTDVANRDQEPVSSRGAYTP